MSTLVTRTYLELRSPDDLRPGPAPRPAPRMQRGFVPVREETYTADV